MDWSWALTIGAGIAIGRLTHEIIVGTLIGIAQAIEGWEKRRGQSE